jgi:hypothetical protein
MERRNLIMLLLISFGIVLVIGIVVAILYNIGPRWIWMKEWAFLLALICISISVFVLLISGAFCLDNHIDWPEDIVRLQTEYLAITNDLEQLNETSLLHTWAIKDSIVNYNTEVYRHKRFVDSPWIGIFYSKEIAAMPLIEFGG